MLSGGDCRAVLSDSSSQFSGHIVMVTDSCGGTAAFMLYSLCSVVEKKEIHFGFWKVLIVYLIFYIYFYIYV
jgi:hypothetical protein